VLHFHLSVIFSENRDPLFGIMLLSTSPPPRQPLISRAAARGYGRADPDLQILQAITEAVALSFRKPRSGYPESISPAAAQPCTGDYGFRAPRSRSAPE
jgi:hypothetical protein